MKRKATGLCAAAALAASMTAPAMATADPNNGYSCHAYVLQLSKGMAATNSTAAAAAYFDVTVRQGQEVISGDCGQS